MNLIHKITAASLLTLALITGLATTTSAADEIDICQVTRTVFNPTTVEFDDENPAPVSIKVTTENCAGRTIYVSLVAVDALGALPANVPQLNEKAFIVPNSTNEFYINLQSGETSCYALGCYYYVLAGVGGQGGTLGGLSTSSSDNVYSSYDQEGGKLDFECEGLCNEEWSFVSTSVDPLTTTTNGQCTVTSAIFNPYTNPENFTPQDVFYESDSLKPLVNVTVRTQNCQNRPIYVNIVEFGFINYLTPNPVDELENMQFTVPESNEITIRLKAGETNCRATDGAGTSGQDCKYAIIAGATPYNGLTYFNHYYSKGKTQGYLGYECDVSCLDRWELLTESTDTENPVEVEDAGSTVDPNSACYDTATQSVKSDCYELYSGLADALNSRLDIADTKFKTLNQDSLGGLINAIIAFAIGIAGILAVGMLMYEGVLYMKSENPSTKTTMKGRMTKTVGGFIGLLFVYALLRTINPDLLNLTPRIDSVDFNTGGDVATVDPVAATGQVSTFREFASSHGITCTGSGGGAAIPGIANSMKGKISYSMPNRGQACSNDTFCWDCSGFVGAVYSCAGLSTPGYTTSAIFTGAQTITEMTNTSVNGQPLMPGDLLGWTQGSLTNGKTEPYGHVVMYIGNGMAIESTSRPRGAGKAIQVKQTTAYKTARLKFIKRLP